MENKLRYVEEGHKTWDSKNFFMKTAWKTHFFNDVANVAHKGEIDFFDALNNFEGNKEKILTFPDCLYKFYRPTLDNLLDIFTNQLYVSSVEQFNDPFDSVIAYNEERFIKQELIKELRKIEFFNKEILAKIENSRLYYESISNTNIWAQNTGFYETIRDISYFAKEKKIVEEIVENKKKVFKNRIDNNISSVAKVACFTTNEDERKVINNSAMWAHYADNGTGVCVKFDISKIGDQISNNTLELIKENELKEKLSSCLFPVSYSSRRPFIINNKKTYFNKEQAFFKSALTKSTSWSKEAEYRLIINSSDDFIVNNKIPFPFVHEVFLGPRMDEKIKRSIAILCNRVNISWIDLEPSIYKYEFIETNKMHGDVTLFSEEYLK